MTTAKLPITAIIVTYHSDAVLPQCVASLGQAQKIIVSSNGSTTKLQDVTFLNNRKNLGFGRAINRALAKVNTPYVLLINPDAILQPNALQKLLQTATAYSEAVIVSPLLEDESGHIRTVWRLGHFSSRPKRRKQEIAGTFCVGHIPAAVWLIKTDYLVKSGGFDKRIFLFFEDDDITLRVRRAGFSILIEPSARAIHLQGKSSPSTLHSVFIKNFHYTLSQIYFTHKYRGGVFAFVVLVRSLINNFFRLLGAIIKLDKFAFLAAISRLFAALCYPFNS